MSWISDEDREYEAYIREMDQKYEREARATAEAQAAQAQAQVLLEQSSRISMSGMMQGMQYSAGSRGSWGMSQSLRSYPSLSRNPNQEVDNFLHSLNNLSLNCIHEIVVKSNIYLQVLSILGYDLTKTEEEYFKSLKYNTFYGSIMLKNESFQFNLDKYMEYGPAEEIK